ncbi:hypothetical protein BpHYR1_012252 [Brachionus plicatilis]|uniref:SOCS box domain-containing protein n=1 Tax=Brachionus plicatilis TaxID=10195 RepID=A0A3M7S976_BRAPC|nr:hypothetical protein BpHYR1_012252 [Brachionus plicatilis]
MSQDKRKHAVLNRRLNFLNADEDVEIKNKRCRMAPDDLNECFRLELSKSISIKNVSLNLKSNFDSSDKICKNLNSIDLEDLQTSQNDTEILKIDRSNFLKYNLSHLNLIKKDTLVFLMEKNFANGIKCPFDVFAYTRLVKMPSPNSNDNNFYNFSVVRKISKLLTHYQNNPLHGKFLRDNSLLPCTVGMFLMPFYFDIFSIRELNEFSPIEIDMILNLKKNYQTQVFLNYDSLISNYKDNILWNCLVIYKYKLDDSTKFGSSRIEYLNYFLAMMYTLYHLEYVIYYTQSSSHEENQVLKKHITRALELNEMILLLFEAYILAGLFTQRDYVEYERFVNKQIDCPMDHNAYNLEKNYYQNTLSMIRENSEKVFPLRLTNLCRIKIKNSMKEYNRKNVSKLPLSKDIKKFILFENELTKNLSIF